MFFFQFLFVADQYCIDHVLYWRAQGIIDASATAWWYFIWPKAGSVSIVISNYCISACKIDRRPYDFSCAPLNGHFLCDAIYYYAWDGAISFFSLQAHVCVQFTSNPNAKHNRISTKCEAENYHAVSTESAVSHSVVIFRSDDKTKHKRFFDHTGALCPSKMQNENQRRQQQKKWKRLEKRTKFKTNIRTTKEICRSGKKENDMWPKYTINRSVCRRRCLRLNSHFVWNRKIIKLLHSCVAPSITPHLYGFVCVCRWTR